MSNKSALETSRDLFYPPTNSSHYIPQHTSLHFFADPIYDMNDERRPVDQLDKRLPYFDVKEEITYGASGEILSKVATAIQSGDHHALLLQRIRGKYKPNYSIGGRLIDLIQTVFSQVLNFFVGLVCLPFGLFSAKWHNYSTAHLIAFGLLGQQLSIFILSGFGFSSVTMSLMQRSISLPLINKIGKKQVQMALDGGLKMHTVGRLLALGVLVTNFVTAVLNAVIGLIALPLALLTLGKVKELNDRVTKGFTALFMLPADVFIQLFQVINPKRILNCYNKGMLDNLLKNDKPSSEIVQAEAKFYSQTIRAGKYNMFDENRKPFWQFVKNS